jgi:hypothetical protein
VIYEKEFAFIDTWKDEKQALTNTVIASWDAVEIVGDIKAHRAVVFL